MNCFGAVLIDIPGGDPDVCRSVIPGRRQISLSGASRYMYTDMNFR